MTFLIRTDLYDAGILLRRAVQMLPFLPPSHIAAFDAYITTLNPTPTSPQSKFHIDILNIHSTIIALLLSLSHPTTLISQITQAKRSIDRSYNSLSRSTRWPLGLLDDTRQRLDREKEEKVEKAKEEIQGLGKELRYSQQVVASELAGWQDGHAKAGRKAIRELVRSMVVVERKRLEDLRRAMRKLKEM